VRQTPLLILAYNRPEKVRALVDRLRTIAPPLVMVVVDGPRAGRPGDDAKVQAVRDAVDGIDWGAEVRTRFRPVNVGLRASVVDAVGWATSEYGQVIVIEEDVLPGPDFIPYAEYMLELFRDDPRIAHISGYNVVPIAAMDNPAAASRLTVYPESIAWATWDRAWAGYDDNLGWGGSATVGALRPIVGAVFAAMRWRQNFGDARAQRISTWAYRWVASMWSHRQLVVSPNHNLVTYVGQDEGTHTETAPPWKELDLYTGDRTALLVPPAGLDRSAERWTNRVVFRGTAFGVARGVAISAVLAWRKRRRRA
jgi:hypothetical protein